MASGHPPEAPTSPAGCLGDGVAVGGRWRRGFRLRGDVEEVLFGQKSSLSEAASIPALIYPKIRIEMEKKKKNLNIWAFLLLFSFLLLTRAKREGWREGNLLLLSSL